MKRLSAAGRPIWISTTLLSALSIVFLSFSIAWAASSKPNEPELAARVSATDIDVGVVYPFAEIDGVSVLVNEGEGPIAIERVESRWKGLDVNVDFKPRTLKAGESVRIPISIKKDGRVGRFSDVLLVYAKGHPEPVTKIVARGFVDWIIDPASMTKDAGIVDAAHPLSATLTVKGRPGVDVRLTEVMQESKWIDAEIADGGKSLKLQAKPQMPWGAFDEFLVLETDNPQQRRVGVQVKGEMRGAVVPSTSLIDFGLVRVGIPAEQLVRLVDESGRKLNVGDVRVTGSPANAAIQECVPANSSCKMLKLSLKEDSIGAAPHGMVVIEFPDYSAELPIPFGGAAIGKDTVIHDLAKEVEAAKSKSPSISAALHETVTTSAPIEMPVPDGRGPLLKWEMANESPIYGYEVYRAAAEAGPFERVNEKMIPRLSSDTRIRSIYRWRDTQAKSGQVYWYYIGVVYLDGHKEALNTAQRVTAK
ncbi:hypothetical protein [Dokdonella immobilis]|uniref:Uncharacterized protein n=1 Tax=Dokdonella immobilis TaxID=578942 RepID=A0A1I4WJQ2_9GAMM|nr:hypothetical protein [Dokdonella immobilis]SFN13685.1 hypothetical protein SAMN05216289_10573 [Dokdonella immobilis]